MINLTKIRYFIAIVDNGSLLGAAQELGVRQSTLSQQLASLEAHLGKRLLTRTSTGVMATEAGRTFYRHARSLAAQIERTEMDVASTGEKGSEQVFLGLATCGAAATLALPILRSLQAEHPSIRIRLNDNFAGILSDFIMTGRIDLALAYTGAPVSGIKFHEMFVEELVLVTAAGTEPRRLRGGAVPLETSNGLPLALLSPIHFVRNVVDRTCARAGFEPKVVAEIDSLAALLEAVSTGLGATILPRAALDMGTPGLSVQSIGPKPLEVTVSLCTSAQLPATQPIELVSALVTSLVEQRLERAS